MIDFKLAYLVKFLDKPDSPLLKITLPSGSFGDILLNNTLAIAIEKAPTVV